VEEELKVLRKLEYKLLKRRLEEVKEIDIEEDNHVINSLEEEI